MTPEELWDIDRKVAEAIGGKASEGSNPREWEYLEIDHREWEFPGGITRDFSEWHPSTDWNDAMFAAEKCLEFVRDYVVFPRGWNKDGSGSVYWVVSKVNSQNELGDDFVSDPSGALAICRAILKLKGQE